MSNNPYMRRVLAVAAAVLMLSMACVAANAANDKPFVIPEIKEWKGGEGHFVPGSGWSVAYASDELRSVAMRLAEDYALMFGVRPEVREGKPRSGDVGLSIKRLGSMGGEGYEMEIGSSVNIRANAPVGAYWATRTLLQMSEVRPDRALPAGLVVDEPDYGFRGLVLDCGRKFVPMGYLRDLVRVLSYYKMNKLHLHLNDNGFKQYYDDDWARTYAAFRMESELYPGLAARDGSYSKQEFKDLQFLASDAFVEIIPEIDIPAHSLAFSHYKPELGSQEYGMDHLDLFNPETYAFFDALLGEYLGGEDPVFKGSIMHIGTDEYSNKVPDVVEKFREFTDHYIREVEKYGKQAYVWGALTHASGATPVKSEGVGMYAWYNGYAQPRDMADLGYKLVSIPDGYVYIVPAAGYYYDYLNIKYLYNEWKPAIVGDVVFGDDDPAVEGGMFAVWNDIVGNGISTKDIHHRLMPAVHTISTKTWNIEPTLAFAGFDSLRHRLSEAPGVNQLGRIGTHPAVVYEADSVPPMSVTPYDEIGYEYMVEFDLEAACEPLNTVLFQSKDAVFYLSDPISGKMGFAREGYLNTFGYKPYAGERAHIAIEGDNRSTTLYVNGRLIDSLQRSPRYINNGTKEQKDYVPTLFFPLARAGNFASRVTNLRVCNHKVYQSADGDQ